MKIKITHIIILILIILISFITTKYFEESNKAKSATNLLNDKVEYYENKLGTQSATISTLEVDKKNLNKIILKKDDTLKKLTKSFYKIESIVKSKTIVKVEPIKIPFEKPIECDFKRFGRFDNKYIQFNYKLSQNEFNFNDFLLINETTIMTGIKRKWFLGNRYLKTDITNSNPYFKTKEIESIKVLIPTKIYDTRTFNIGVGLVLGVLISR